jgi:hypothetical protein
MSRIFLIAVVSFLSVVCLEAQTVLGTMTGRVLDASGASIAGAAVTATNTGTNLVFRTTTNDSGNYVLQQLPVGTYELAVEATGFRRYVRRNITERGSDPHSRCES